MIKSIKKAFVLGMTSLILFAGLPATTAHAADSEPIHTVTSVSGKESNPVVTYELKFDKTRVTDGRVAVLYDPEVLTLAQGKGNVNFSERDFNKDYKEGDQTGISYAFVHDEGKYVKGSLLTLTFYVKPGIESQSTTFKTEVFQISDGDKDVLTNVVLEDAVEVGRPKLVAPANVQATQGLIGVDVSWDEVPGADGYAIYRKTFAGGTYSLIGTTTGNSYNNIMVSKDVTYYYQVKAYQKQGKEKVYSEPSAPVSIKVKGLLEKLGG